MIGPGKELVVEESGIQAKSQGHGGICMGMGMGQNPNGRASHHGNETENWEDDIHISAPCLTRLEKTGQGIWTR